MPWATGWNITHPYKRYWVHFPAEPNDKYLKLILGSTIKLPLLHIVTSRTLNYWYCDPISYSVILS